MFVLYLVMVVLRFVFCLGKGSVFLGEKEGRVERVGLGFF